MPAVGRRLWGSDRARESGGAFGDGRVARRRGMARARRRTAPRVKGTARYRVPAYARRAIFREKAGWRSCAAAQWGRRGRRFREKVIGRTAAVRTWFGGDVQGVGAAHGLSALLHQPACQHGRRIFLQVLIQKGADLLSQVGGVRKPREFVGLQRVFGRREKELPGRLGWVQGQGGPPVDNRRVNDNATVIHVKIYDGVRGCGKVWKTLAGAGAFGRRPGVAPGACSACEGDYEDPERTAWRESEEERRAREEEGCDGDAQGS